MKSRSAFALLPAVFAGFGLAATAIVALPSVASAQSAPVIYPAGGQSPEKQAQDDGECRAWASQQMGGFAPGAGPAQVSDPNAGQGEVVQGAARGAILGVVGGAIAGDVGEGAAIGAGLGATHGLFNRMDANRNAENQQNAANQAYAQQTSQYYRNYGACMGGRGYTVN